MMVGIGVVLCVIAAICISAALFVVFNEVLPLVWEDVKVAVCKKEEKKR